MAKIIKSFKELNKINRRELFRPISEKNRELRLIQLDPVYAISIARQLADGFDDIDLRKKPTKNQYRRAREIITDYYEAARGQNVEIVRPTKRNRKLYAERIGVTSRFRFYPINHSSENSTIKIKNGKLIEKSEFVNYERFTFNRKSLAKNSEKEVKRVFKTISTKYRKGIKEVRIVCGKYVTNWHIKDRTEMEEELITQVDFLQNSYGNWKEWLNGIEVQVFLNQKKRPKKKSK